jgi:ketol-acid reductoisomerase
LEEIQTGVFAKGWILENQANRPVFNAINRRENEHPLEVVGRRLRELMPFIQRERKEANPVTKGVVSGAQN